MNKEKTKPMSRADYNKCKYKVALNGNTYMEHSTTGPNMPEHNE